MIRTDTYSTVYVPATGRYVTTRATEGTSWAEARYATENANPTSVAGSQPWHCYGCGRTVNHSHKGCQI